MAGLEKFSKLLITSNPLQMASSKVMGMHKWFYYVECIMTEIGRLSVLKGSNEHF